MTRRASNATIVLLTFIAYHVAVISEVGSPALALFALAFGWTFKGRKP